MKKLIFAFIALILGTLVMQSCLGDDDHDAEVSCSYIGALDSIAFINPADSIYVQAIYDAMASKGMLLVDANSMFEVSDKGNTYDAAVRHCHNKAIEQYQQRILAASTKQLKNIIRSNTSDSLDVSKLGGFTVKYALYGYTPFYTDYMLITTYLKTY